MTHWFEAHQRRLKRALAKRPAAAGAPAAGTAARGCGELHSRALELRGTWRFSSGKNWAN